MKESEVVEIDEEVGKGKGSIAALLMNQYAKAKELRLKERAAKSV